MRGRCGVDPVFSMTVICPEERSSAEQAIRALILPWPTLVCGQALCDRRASIFVMP
jgi:hypothetical protein